MAAKKPAPARYRVLRDVAISGQLVAVAAGEIVELEPDVAALLIRDGMVAPVEEE